MKNSALFYEQNMFLNIKFPFVGNGLISRECQRGHSLIGNQNHLTILRIHALVPQSRILQKKDLDEGKSTYTNILNCFISI